MIIIQQPSDLRTHLAQKQHSGATVGFVPTMGALHQGHLSLVTESLKKTTLTVCSIFVNPTQFNDPADYQKYPKRLSDDIKLLENAGTSVLFLPSTESIYGSKPGTLERYDLGYLETILEGSSRPGHFQGVCQVMFRLLKAVRPEFLFMGRKDYQQCMVVRHLLRIANFNTGFVACDTVRENDGLAMSSRNLRLSAEERQRAPYIYRALREARKHLKEGRLEALKSNAITDLTENGFVVDYFEFASAKDLTLLNEWDGRTPVIALAAAYLGQVRLIDNLLLHE